MTIQRVASQASGGVADSTTLVAEPFTVNVTAGSLIVVLCGKYTPTVDAFVAGDCTKSAGTATIDTPTLDVSLNFNYAGTDCIAVGIWSALVTGSGSLTMQVGSSVAGSFFIIGVNEYSGNWDGSRLEDSSSASAATGAPNSGDSTSAGAALFVGVTTTTTNAPTTHTLDGAYTLIFEEEDGSTHATGSTGDQIVAVGTTDSFSLTAPTTERFAAALAVYKEAAGGGGPSVGPVGLLAQRNRRHRWRRAA